MSDKECSNCARLQAENARLREEIKHLRAIIQELLRTLKRIQDYCRWILQLTGRILNKRSGVPRGKWAYARGANAVAEKVLSLAQKGVQ